ncbi:MAG: type transport system permease protein [Acidobacteriaceae bacterium]|nr:type transport system permease protein [Acidobacteriaceae bacterium]
MADLAGPISLADQIRLVAGLRWRMLINGLRGKNNVLDLVGMGFVSFFGLILVIGPSFAFYFAGYSFVSDGRLQWLAAPFWAIFIFWQVIPVFAAGFGSRFEFRTLLRFPFSPSAFYLISLAYGIADFPALASICWLLVMTTGATAAKPSVLPIMLVVSILIMLLNVTMERLIGSWLERLLARRRSREIFVGIFILFMFSMQFITPIQRQYVKRNPNPGALVGMIKYLAPFPPSLSARVVAGAVRRDFADMALGLAGLAGFVFLFSALLWQRYSAQYRGEEVSESPAPSQAVPVRAVRGTSIPQIINVNRTSSGVLPPMIGPIVRKEFSYLIRNGFAFFLLVLPPAQMLLFSSQFGGKDPLIAGRALHADLFFPAMMAYTVLVMMGPAYNAFAYEGRGIQTYFTAPLRFSDIFAGKNLVSAAVIAFEVAICGIVLAWAIGSPSIPALLATIFALIFTVSGQLPIANWASLSFPRKLEFGSMRGQRNSGVSVWIMFGAQIVLAGISALVLSTARWSGNPWLPAEGFAFLAAAAFGGYFASLQPLSGLAETKKEILIEALCR